MGRKLKLDKTKKGGKKPKYQSAPIPIDVNNKRKIKKLNKKVQKQGNKPNKNLRRETKVKFDLSNNQESTKEEIEEMKRKSKLNGIDNKVNVSNKPLKSLLKTSKSQSIEKKEQIEEQEIEIDLNPKKRKLLDLENSDGENSENEFAQNILSDEDENDEDDEDDEDENEDDEDENEDENEDDENNEDEDDEEISDEFDQEEESDIDENIDSKPDKNENDENDVIINIIITN